MAYDSKCYDLAEAFLSDVQNPVKHEDAHKLAQDIQSVIEDYLNDLERCPNCQGGGCSSCLPEIPPAMQADLDASIRRGKIMADVIESLFFPKVTK